MRDKILIRNQSDFSIALRKYSRKAPRFNSFKEIKEFMNGDGDRCVFYIEDNTIVGWDYRGHLLHGALPPFSFKEYTNLLK